MLLVLTVGLATFTVSMARTLDRHLSDFAYYGTGGDFLLRERGELVGGDEEAPPESEAPAPEQTDSEDTEEHWQFLPAFDYLNVPGVQSVTRFGNYKARVPWAPELDEARIAGIDPDGFLEVVRFRSDYSTHPGPAIMRTLVAEPAAVLVERSFFKRHRLRVGDLTTLGVFMMNQWIEMDFLVAGTIDYFPGLYPEDGPFFVANLSHLFAKAGGMYSYFLWLKTEEELTEEELEDRIRQHQLTASVERSALDEIGDERRRPERQGFFGLLTVGFFASAAITAIGFLIYSLVSFQRRSIELGVLRSIGLSSRQLAAYVVGEQLSLVVVGVIFGTVLGMVTGVLFVPFLQVGSDEHAQTPPFVVQIPWNDIAVILFIFGSMLVIVIAITVWLLRHMEIFQAVKMEEVE
jgi:putative ABC transport system permease protein